MEINSIGTEFINSPGLSFGSPSASVTANSVESGAFDSLLKRVENAQGSQVAQSRPLMLPKNTEIDKRDKLYELCLELETFLIKNLIKSMRGTVQKSKLIDTGLAGEMYEDMLYDEYAKVYAGKANFGFAEMAYRELKSIS